MSNRFYITTAIDYVNSKPHLGTAYEKMAADVIARFQRGMGRDVHFLMGNDEHSLKVAQAAREQGLEPLEYCDRMEQVFRGVWDALDVRPDDFIRTTEERHKRAVREMVARIHAAGDLYQGAYEGWYCVGCEAFKKEEDLREGCCPDHPQREISWLKEENWFFKLSRYRDALREHYERHPEFVRPDYRRNELLSLLEAGLEDVSVSRSSVDWGVSFPFDESAVVYVWFDALINYISAVGFPDDEDMFQRWWPADLHLIGKDITRFHCIIWPAMLMSAGIALPRCVFGHGFVNMGGDRMSKSSGLAASPTDLAAKYGPDAIRYWVCREAAFGQDMDYTEERLIQRYTGELSNGLGNLASRIEAMVVKYQEGVVGPCPEDSPLLRKARKTAAETFPARMEDLDLKGGVMAAMEIIAEANLYVDRAAPFRLAKDPGKKDEVRRVLGELANALLIAASLLHPVMPRKMGELVERFTGQPVDDGNVVRNAATIQVPPDRRLARGPVLFPRLEEQPQ